MKLKPEFFNFLMETIMSKYTKHVAISKTEIEKLQEFLDGRGEGTINVIKVFTVKFEDSIEKNIEVDIKICDGDTPFVDAVMFQNGNEVGCLEPTDTLVGEYIFQDFLKNTYEVFVVAL